MKEEYDFSGGERGKFYKKDAVFNLPSYADESAGHLPGRRRSEKGTDTMDAIDTMDTGEDKEAAWKN